MISSLPFNCGNYVSRSTSKVFINLILARKANSNRYKHGIDELFGKLKFESFFGLMCIYNFIKSQFWTSYRWKDVVRWGKYKIKKKMSYIERKEYKLIFGRECRYNIFCYLRKKLTSYKYWKFFPTTKIHFIFQKLLANLTIYGSTLSAKFCWLLQLDASLFFWTLPGHCQQILTNA